MVQKTFQREVKNEEKKVKPMFKIEPARDKDDFDNMNFQPSDGSIYTAKDAIFILENKNGGAMIETKTGKGYIVNYKKEENQWLKEELNF